MPESRGNEFVDLYELLEISPHASQDVIQAAYRVLVRNNHPDVNATAAAELRIRQLNAAYSVLSDPGDRARYDLACTRVRRNERVTQADQGSPATAFSGARRAPVLELRPAVARHSVDERLAVLSGPTLLGLLVVAVMVGFLLVILWATFDVAADYNAGYAGPSVEWSGR